MRHQLLIFLLSCFFLTSCTSESLAPRQAVTQSFDGERIAYEVSGSGETTLVFVHGSSCDGRYWRNQLDAFAKDYQVVNVDLAGHGHSSQGRSVYTMEAFAKDLQAVVEAEGVHKAVLIGHSMGGAVIAEAARLMPDTVVGLVGVDTLQNVAERIPQSVIDEMAEPFETDFVAATKAFVAPMLPEGTDQQLVHWVLEDMSSAPKAVAISAFRNYLGRYVSGEAAAVFSEVHVPVVTINARQWPSNPQANEKHISDYRLLYIDDSGHFPMLEVPEAFNGLLREVLEPMALNSGTDA